MNVTKRQARAANKLLPLNGGAVWWRVGQGKTRVALKYFALVAKEKDDIVRIVFVTTRKAFYDLAEEVKNAGLDWNVREVDSEEDVYPLSTLKKSTIFVVSHGMIAKLVKDRPNPKDKNSGPLIRESHWFDGVVYDEGYLYKNNVTMHCRAANRLAKAVPHALILSGSMMTARNLEDIYGQMYAIDKHHALAPTKTKFRSRYMLTYALNPQAEYGEKIWRNAPMRGAAEQIAQRIKPLCSVYFPKNLREVRHIIKHVPASVEQKQKIRDLKQYMEIAHSKGVLELTSAPSVIIKAQQISDGWVKIDDGHSEIVDSAKLDYLEDMLRELIDSGECVIIWCAFQNSVNRVLQRMQKVFPKKIGVYGFHGSKKFDDAGWRKNGRIAVATVGSGAAVNHFKHCAYAIYYSMDYRWTNLQQSRGRTDRKDSRHSTCFYYYLQTKGSLDSFVYRTAIQSSRKEKELINLTELKQWARLKV
jgi:hypothetical protein